jgi:hypothetical protein
MFCRKGDRRCTMTAISPIAGRYDRDVRYLILPSFVTNDRDKNSAHIEAAESRNVTEVAPSVLPLLSGTLGT